MSVVERHQFAFVRDDSTKLLQEVRHLMLPTLSDEFGGTFDLECTSAMARLTTVDHPIKARQPLLKLDVLDLRFNGNEAQRVLVADIQQSFDPACRLAVGDAGSGPEIDWPRCAFLGEYC